MARNMEEYTLFQKYIIEDLDEFDDFNIIGLIAVYKEHYLNYKVLYPLWDYKENFEISDNDFNNLRNEILDLMGKEDLGLYIYIGVHVTWEESYKRLSDKETAMFLANKENWIWKGENEVYYLIRNSNIPYK